MMPIDLTFRRMLLKYIPQVSEYDIRKYESLIALRHQLIHEEIVKPTPIPSKSGTVAKHPPVGGSIGLVTEDAQKIFKAVEPNYNRVHKLEIATRQFALEQGKYLQVPPTFKGGVNYIAKFFKFRWIQLSTLPFLWLNKGLYSMTHLTIPKIAATTISTVLVVSGIGFGLQKMQKPEVSQIPDQTIGVGESFSPIKLDDYVTDKNNPDSTMTWSHNFCKNLKVTIDTNRIANIEQLHKGWTGISVFIFTATDPTGLSDCDTVLFIVKPVKDSSEVSNTNLKL
jgi:hypothetical protein